MYTPIVGDLLHYGHLMLLKSANSLGDYHVCGVLTDSAADSYRGKPVANLKERKAVIDHLDFLDRVVIQDSKSSVENLKKLKEEFGDSKIIVVYGDSWKKIPGESYMKENGIEIARLPYYQRLSNFKMIGNLGGDKKTFENIKEFTEYFKVGGYDEFNNDLNKQFIISTKANTLKSLQPLLHKSKVEDSYVFNVSNWKGRRDEIVARIQQTFNNKIIIRSSALNEDTMKSAMAGYFYSALDVDVNSKIKLRMRLIRL